MTWANPIIPWLAPLLALSPLLAGLVACVYQGCIRPRLVPRKTIEALADQIIAQHPGDPEGWAFRAEETAWLRGQMFEQGQWHRVRRTIRKRRRAHSPNL